MPKAKRTQKAPGRAKINTTKQPKAANAPAAFAGVYTGTKQQPNPPYLPADELRDAVNLSIFLKRRPLLLKGEPGCGKTQLARAVATEFGLIDEKNAKSNRFFFWPVKSTSRAKDGLYTFDAVQRLQDAQLAATNKALRKKVADPKNYINLGPLGCAFECSTAERPAIVLIDEIDKADIDFPNDLLLELDEQKFEMTEVPDKPGNLRWVQAKYPPIVFITSNDEKDLPDAFLRRCLFHYVDFPGENKLIEIVKAHINGDPGALLADAVTQFMKLREQMDKAGVRRKPSTGEFIDWFALLNHSGARRIDLGQLVYREALLKSRLEQDKYTQRDHAS